MNGDYKMKKINTILTIIFIIVMVTFIGCSSNDNTNETDESIQTDDTTQPDETDETDETNANEAYDYSAGITDNGFFENISALEHVTLSEYKGITISSDIHEISEEAVQTALDNLLSNYTTEAQITDRAIQDGDTVNIDYVGSVDGVEFEGGSTGGSGTNVTIGVTNYIDDFLEQLIGHTPGESFDIEVTFPEDYGNESLKGKDAIFAITINYIIESITPDLNDEFVAENLASNYEWNTVEEMKEGIKNDLQTSAIESYIQSKIVESSTISSLPDKLLQYQKNSIINYYQSSADYYNMELEDFLSTYAGYANIDEVLDAYATKLTDAANYYLIIQAIAEDANISVTKDDLTTYFTEYVGTDDYSQYEEQYGLPHLMLSVLHQSVLDYIVDNAVLE